VRRHVSIIAWGRVDTSISFVVPTTWASIVRDLPAKALNSRDLHLSRSKVLIEVLISTKDRGIIASGKEEVFRYPVVVHVSFNSSMKKSILVQ
jgi:hypothetical protein